MVCLDFNPILRYYGVKCTREHVTQYQEDMKWLCHSDKIKSWEIKPPKELNVRKKQKDNDILKSIRYLLSSSSEDFLHFRRYQIWGVVKHLQRFTVLQSHRVLTAWNRWNLRGRGKFVPPGHSYSFQYWLALLTIFWINNNI